jgi:hypothetical protein
VDEIEKAQILSRIERLQALLKQLEKATATERVTFRDRASRELKAAKEMIKALKTHDPI